MHELGKGLVVLGLLLTAVGAALLLAHKLPLIGKLPGDILIKRGNFTFYAPLATGIVLSLLVSLILFLIGKFR
ncbi:MAG: DUF2905 domain-containing protein [Nitrospirota bacterium]|nr:DUF2905 domain-containing protein [Nitrospirota bacterium]